MPLYLKEIFNNRISRTLMLVLIGLFIFSGMFTYYDYQRTLSALEKQEQARLLGIARTISSQIDGEAHFDLYSGNKKKDDIKSLDQNDTYHKIHDLLKTVKQTNNLPTDVYTAVFNEKDNNFHFVVTSNEKPYFRHKWNKFDKKLVNEIESGSTIDRYETENGIWLSAFAPLKNHGDFHAVVQVDFPFKSFINEAQQSALKNSWLVAGVLFILSIVLYSIMVSIIRKEKRIKKKLAIQHLTIANKNKSIISSIHSAKRIQESILPPISKIKKEFPEFFVVYKPKDIVSGDFFWYYTIGHISYFAVSDCTGHGVPGAMVTMLGQAILKDIIKGQENITPAEILNELNERLAKTINHKKYDIPEGMDISICRMSRNENTIQYAGAFRPMIMIRNNQMNIIAGNKYSIGGNRKNDTRRFDNQIVHVQAGDRFYLYSDGFCDQFGGERGKKYMTKRFKDFILRNQDMRMEDQRHLFNYEFHHWQQDEEQVDDVLVAGFEIPGIDYSKSSFPQLKVVA